MSPNKPNSPVNSLFPFNPTEPEPRIPPAPPGISEVEAKDKILNKYYFLGNIAQVLEKDLPTLLTQIPYQGDKYPNSTFEEMVARNEAILKQKKLKGFTSLSTKSRENYDKFSEMRKEKQRFLFVSLMPRKSDNTVDWKKLLKMIEQEISLLRLDKIEAYIKDKVNPSLAEWFEKIPGPGDFPSDPAARLALFNKIIEENTNIELPMIILIDMWQELKAGKRVFMGLTYFKLSIEPGDGGVLALNSKHGNN